jgi:ankyrin repeat protein
VAKRLLKEHDVAINATDRTGIAHNAVMLAIRHNYDSILDLLLARDNINLGPYDEYCYISRTVLLYACTHPSRSAAVAKILKVRSDLLEIKDLENDSYTPLLQAITSGATESLQLLLDARADIHQRDSMGGTAVMRAIDSGHTEAVRLLVQHGARIDDQDKLSRTMLHAAAISARYSVLAYLLETYKDIDINVQDSDGVTPLHDAVRRGSRMSVMVLVGANARCDIPDKLGCTAIDRAVDLDDDDILRTLSKAPGFYNHADTSLVQKSLIVAIESETDDELKARIAQASPEELNKQGTAWDGTPLHKACACGRSSVIRMLADAGADLNLQNPFGRTPLFMAIDYERIDAAATLIALGADVNKSYLKSVTPWGHALFVDSIEIAMLIIEAGADIPLDSEWSLIALHFAIDLGYPDAVKRLVEGGTSTEHKYQGLSAWQRAANLDDEVITEFFCERFTKKRAESMMLLAEEKLQTPGNGVRDPNPAAIPITGLLNVASSWLNDFIIQAFKICKTPSFVMSVLTALLSIVLFMFIRFMH